MTNLTFTAPLLGMWDEMQPNLADHNISVVRSGDMATFVGAEDEIDCFISKHYDGSGLDLDVRAIAN